MGRWVTIHGNHVWIGDNDGDNYKQTPEDNNASFGTPGTYKAYRAGDIRESHLGFLSFGLDKSQSEVYSKMHSAPINKYYINITNPYYIEGSDIDEMQSQLTKKYAGKSYEEGKTLEESRKIMSVAAKKLEELGYDSILMKKVNKLTKKETYEIGVLNSYIRKAIKSAK